MTLRVMSLSTITRLGFKMSDPSTAPIQEFLMRAHNPGTLSITDAHTLALPLFHLSSWQHVQMFLMNSHEANLLVGSFRIYVIVTP